MKTKFQDYGSNHVLLQVEDKEPIPDTIILLDQKEEASTYKIKIRNRKFKTPSYHYYDSDKDKGKYYHIDTRCTNCLDHDWIAIPIHTKINFRILANTPCDSCKVKKTLKMCFWNGNYYEFLETKKDTKEVESRAS